MTLQALKILKRKPIPWLIIPNILLFLILFLVDLNNVKLLYQFYDGIKPEETDFTQRGDKGDALIIVYSYERCCLNINILDNEFKDYLKK